MNRKFYWVDAFTDKKLGGNPCAVIFSADQLSDQQMLSLAKEMNLSETAFVVTSSKADFGARYFTPASEIPLAGHPTIATIHALVEAGKIQLESAKKEISLELKAGVIKVEIFHDHNANTIVMTQKKPQFLTIHDSKKTAALFGLTEADLVPNVPIQTVSTGTPQLMIAVRSKEILRKINMNVSAYKEYKSQSDFFSPHLFCTEGETSEGATFARHPGVPPELAEDAFTGSSTGGMAAYLWHYNLISTPRFIAEQGHWLGRPGKATVEIIGDRKNIEAVKVGGQAVTIISGELGDF